MHKTSLKKNTNNIIFLILSLYYVASTIMPFVSRIINAYIFMLVVLLLYAYIFFHNPKDFERYLTFLLPFLPLIALNLLDSYLNGRQELALFIYQQMLAVFPAFLAVMLIYRNMQQAIKTIIIAAVLAYIITAVTTYIGLATDPMAARFLATVANSKDPYFISLNLKNIGGYDTVYSVVLIYPMLICLYKQRKIKPIVMLAVVAILFIYVLKTAYAMALIFFIFSSLLLIQKKRLSIKKMAGLILLLLILLALLVPFIASTLYTLSARVGSTTLAERFKYIADMLTGTETSSDVGGRLDRYLLSINAFLQHPLLGNFLFQDGAIGGHSTILDTLGSFGLVGAGALYIMYRHIYKRFYRPFRDSEYYGYMIWSFLQALLLSSLNTGSWLFIIAFLVPLTGVVLRSGNKSPEIQNAELGKSSEPLVKVDAPS